MKKSRIIVFIILAGLIASFFAFDLGQYFSLEYFKSHQQEFDRFYQDNPQGTVAAYFLIYIVATGLSLPGAAVLTLIGGAVFGLLWGTVIVSFASSIGATLAFLASRFLFRDAVQRKFGSHLNTVNKGIEKEGGFYLFTLRLVPIVPFFVINLVMGLTPIRTVSFYIISQIGMLAGTLVYVNAGTQLAKIESLSGILSPGLIASFVLLGFFPLIAKKLVDYLKSRKLYRHYPKPDKFDANLVVIGAGSAGLVASLIAATVKAKVVLIEKHKMGGDCLNTGCVPSKALIRSAKYLHQLKRAEEFGFKEASVKYNFADVMHRVQRIIATIEPHDSVERYTALGVECVIGNARIINPYQVEVNGRTINTRNIVIASGAAPFVPPIKGVENIDILTSDNLWALRELPEKLLVLGGGPIGCELSQAFARLGSQVTLVEMLPRLLIREDPDVANFVLESLTRDGVDVRTSHRATEFVEHESSNRLRCESGDRIVDFEFDRVLVAVGRAANITGFGAKELGIHLSAKKTFEVNEFLQTNFPNIYACGDVAGPYQFTHTASHQAWYATVNALFGGVKKFRVDYRVIPWVTFTDPEVARVGLNELEAKEKNIAYEVTRYDMAELDRAITESEQNGVVKVLTEPGKDRILGVSLVGPHAGDLLAEFVLAMKHNLGLNKILGTIHSYPTLAEANKFAAGNWKKAHKPERILDWLQGHFQRRLG